MLKLSWLKKACKSLLEDETWVLKLMFLTDITGQLNKLNHQLQGADRTALNMFETWVAFVDKLAVLQIILPPHSDISNMYRSCPHSAAFQWMRYPNTFPNLNQSSKHDLETFRNMNTFSFLINPEIFNGHKFDKSLIENGYTGHGNAAN